MEQELGQSSCVYKINPGFHFQPTALEVIVHYLQPWVVGLSYYSGIINEHVDLYHNVTPDQLKGAYLLCNYYLRLICYEILVLVQKLHAECFSLMLYVFNTDNFCG